MCKIVAEGLKNLKVHKLLQQNEIILIALKYKIIFKMQFKNSFFGH
jgi:hypothetical protein